MTAPASKPLSPLSAAQRTAAEAQRLAQGRRRRRLSQSSAAANPSARVQPEPVSPSQRAGGLAEERAWQFLAEQGCRLVARNQRFRVGELDLVVWHGASLVFVEVRWRNDARLRHGGALASVGLVKQRRVWLAAQLFLQRHWPAPARRPPCRFDIVAIDGAALRWVRAAFSGAWPNAGTSS